MKKCLCIVLSFVMLMFTFAACTKKEKVLSADVTTQTNGDGNAYIDVTDEKGNNITNKSGEAVTSILSDKEKSSLAAVTTAKKANAEKSTSNKQTGSTKSTTMPIDSVTASKDDLLHDGTTVKKTTLKDDVISKVFNTGKFTISANMISDGNKVPVKIMVTDKKLCFEMTYSQMVVRALFMNDKIYITMPALKSYMETDSDEMGSIGDIANVQGKQTFVSTTKVKDGSKTYTCEQYKTEDGSIFKYYFDGKTWARLEMIAKDGTISVLEITSFNGKADSSVFSLSGLKKYDMNSLAGTTVK